MSSGDDMMGCGQSDLEAVSPAKGGEGVAVFGGGGGGRTGESGNSFGLKALRLIGGARVVAIAGGLAAYLWAFSRDVVWAESRIRGCRDSQGRIKLL
jgi:hypothetical protein